MPAAVVVGELHKTVQIVSWRLGERGSAGDREFVGWQNQGFPFDFVGYYMAMDLGSEAVAVRRVFPPKRLSLAWVELVCLEGSSQPGRRLPGF